MEDTDLKRISGLKGTWRQVFASTQTHITQTNATSYFHRRPRNATSAGRKGTMPPIQMFFAYKYMVKTSNVVS